MGDKKKCMVICVCMDDDCKDRKARKVRQRFRESVEARGLSESVKVKKCSCLGNCKHGPVVEVKPGGKQYEEVKPKSADAILDELFD